MCLVTMDHFVQHALLVKWQATPYHLSTVEFRGRIVATMQYLVAIVLELRQFEAVWVLQLLVGVDDPHIVSSVRRELECFGTVVRKIAPRSLE